MSEFHCPVCGSPMFASGCDCWKERLAPSTRDGRLLLAIARWEARNERERFEARQRARHPGDVIRGQFGSRKAERRSA